MIGRALPSPASRAYRLAFPGAGSKIRDSIPSRCSAAASQRAAAISLPGGLVVLMRMYCESSAAASSPRPFQSSSTGAAISATRSGVCITGAFDGPASGGAGLREQPAITATSATSLHQPPRTSTIRHLLSLERKGLTMPELSVAVVRESGCDPRCAGPPRRLVHCFIGELECTPMDRDHGARAEQPECVDGFFRIHVEITHEPARLIGADGEQRRIERPVARADRLEFRMKTGVPREVDAPAAGVTDGISAPQRVAPVAECTAAEMHRGRRGDAQRPDRALLPPVQLDDGAAHAALGGECAELEREDPRGVWMIAREPPHRGVIEVIVVI